MSMVNQKTSTINKRSPKVVEMTPDFGCRVLKLVEDRIVYAFARKGRAIKSLAAEHRVTEAEIQNILRERIVGQKVAA